MRDPFTYNPNIRLDAYYKEIEVFEQEFYTTLRRLMGSVPQMKNCNGSWFNTTFTSCSFSKGMKERRPSLSVTLIRESLVS